MMKTAVIGASGFIGAQLLQAYRRVYPDAVGTSFSRQGESLKHLDITRPDLSGLGLVESGHKAVLIAAAKPNIAFCESHKEESHAVNVAGVLEVARQAAGLGLKPIFLSSDYVFDGRSGQYDDDAATDPSTAYGRQKQAVERAMPEITNDYLVLRLSKVYGLSKGDGTLLDEIACALAGARQIKAAWDMVFSPTLIDDLVQNVLAIQKLGLRGVINVCHPEPASRYDVALAMAQALKCDSRLVQRIALHDIPALAGRPLNTSMRTSRLTREINPQFTPLDASIARVAANWIQG